MSAFWSRQLEFLKAMCLALLMCGIAGLMSWISGGGKFYEIVLGMALFQACLATVRAGK